MNQANKRYYLSCQFIKEILKHFISHECLKSAAALSFTTILSIVPIIALLFFSASQFMSDPQNQIIIQNKLLTFFSPSIGDELQSKILLLAQQASELRTLGILALLVTVLLALNTVDETINRIWDLKRHKRTFIKLFLYFCALMTLPILLGLSLSVSAYFLSLTSLDKETLYELGNSIFVHFGSILVTWLAFFIIYKWVPNIKVEFKPAVISGFVAATLFEGAKFIFLIYIHYFSSYDLIYGAFSVLPLFCIWIYISWVIILAGAVLTYSLNEWKTLRASLIKH